MLSAGFFGFYGHAGFVEALAEAGVTPGAWAGTSAGGLVAAFGAAGLEPRAITERVLAQRRSHFWDPDVWGIALDTLKRGHRPSGLLRGDRFRGLLSRLLPVATFEALRQPLVLVATDLTHQRAEILRTGDLPSAVHATCAYPGLFQAVRRDARLLWDGGIIDKAPAVALHDAHGAELDALLIHHLPSRDDAREPSGALAWPQGMARGFASVRREYFKLQLQVLGARRVPTFIISSHLPRVGPGSMEAGATAVEAARARTLEALHQPPQPFCDDAQPA